jgi:hypothetical protein
MIEIGGWFYEIEGVRRGPVPLAELQRLARARQVGASTQVWAEGMEQPVAAGTLAVLFPPKGDAAMRWLLPVGRSGFAIAAGYLGLLSVIPYFSLVALAFAGLAIRDLRRHPELSGWGRVIFALVMGSLFTVIYGLAFLA